MADQLESVNTLNAKTKKINVRLLHCEGKSPKESLSVFSCRALTDTGCYTIAEEAMFGSKEQQDKRMKELKLKRKEGSTWTFAKMVGSKKKPAFQGCAHDFIITLNGKLFEATVLKGQMADKIGKEIEPALVSGDLLLYSASQLVDVTGFCLTVPAAAQKKDKMLVEVILLDAQKRSVPMNLWEGFVSLIPTGMQGKVLYIFNAYLTKGDGGVHLTPRKDTKVMIATGNLPIAKSLVEADLAQATPSQNLGNSFDARDYTVGEAIATNVSMLDACLTIKDKPEDRLFELSSVLVSLDDPSSLLTKAGDRIYTPVTISDRGGSANAFLPEDPALALAGVATVEDFGSGVDRGALRFKRGHIRVRLAPLKGQAENRLTIVCAVPRLFETPVDTRIVPNDGRIIPCLLSAVSPSPTGKLSVDLGDSVSLLASGALILVKAVQDPEADVINGDAYVIKNYVVDSLDTSQTPVQFKAITTVDKSRSAYYQIMQGEQALVHVTSINTETKSLVVADMWPIRPSDDASKFSSEVVSAKTCLAAPAHILKRKWDEGAVKNLDEFLNGAFEPPCKKVHTSFDC